MPVDPSIPLDYKQPQFEGPMQLAGQALQLKNLQNQNQAGQLQNQQMSLQMQNQMALRAALQDPNSGLRDKSGNIDPNALMRLGPAGMGMAKEVAGTQQEIAAAQKSKQEAAMQRQDKHLASIDALAYMQPTGGPEDLQRVHQQIDENVRSGLIQPDEATAAHAKVPTDPSQLPDFYRKIAATRATAALQMAGTTGKIMTANGQVIDIGQAPGMNPQNYKPGATPAPTGVQANNLYTAPKQNTASQLEKMASAIPGGIGPDGKLNLGNPDVKKLLEKAEYIAPNILNQITAHGIGGGGTFMGMTKDDIGDAARAFRKTGQLPAVGFGSAGTALRAQIYHEAGQQARAEGLIPDYAVAGMTYAGDKASLAKAVAQKDAVVSYEGMLTKNYQNLLSQWKQLAATGSPALDKPLRQVASGMFGDAGVAAAKMALSTVIPEIAKIRTGQVQNGVLTDAARKEVVDSGLDEGATFNQLKQMFEKTILPDARNRESSLNSIVKEITGRVANSSGPGSPAPSATTLPKGVIGTTVKDGKTYYQWQSDNNFHTALPGAK